MVGEKRISSRAFSTILIFLAVLAFSSWSGYSSEGIIKINQRAEITRTFHADIGRVVDAVEKGDSDGLKNQVIIFVKYGFDFESVRSTIVYLKNETKEAEYFLRFEDNPESGFPQTLKNELFRFAREGNQEWGISPNAKFSYRQNSIVNNVCVFWEPLLESPRDCSANILVRWRS
jgi:hypothetical protein